MKAVLYVLSMFCSTTGKPDLSRVIVFKLSSVLAASMIYAVFWLHQVPGWSDFCIGAGTFMTGGAAFIGGKEIAVAKANATAAAGAASVAP